MRRFHHDDRAFLDRHVPAAGQDAGGQTRRPQQDRPGDRRAGGGAGLGLAIARNLARTQGGEVSLRNRPEGGLEVTLSLPRCARA
ncbi:MAG: hypothetical protein FJX78_09035 [Armatimonadetes bacterium]|nr:hypothetical protein [Armatimonadota bacterium]